MIAEKRGPVGRLIFNNPERRNAVSQDMMEAIPGILDAFNADPDIRLVIMSGSGGKAFVSGADISQFEARRNSAAADKAYTEISSRAWEAMESCQKPLIAEIRGFCIGGGLAIALRADIRLATEGSEFGVPAARLGVAYPPGSVDALVALVGPSAAKWILFSGERLSAEEAKRIGLIDKLVAADGMDAAIERLVGTLADNAPLSIRYSKAAVDFFAHGRGDVNELAKLSSLCMDSADFKEGREAFMEKRRPKFVGA